MIKRKTINSLALICIFTVYGCSAETESPYPIYEIDHAATGGDIQWIDNNRVLFMGFEGGGKPMSKEEQEQIKKAIYIWDIEKNTVEFYAYSKAGFCYHEGYIRYPVEYETVDDEKSKRLVTMTAVGMMGKEEIQRWDLQGRSKEEKIKWVGNNFNCQRVERPDNMVGRVMIPLLPEHGYLDFSIPEKNQFEALAVLVKPVGNPIDTNFPRKAKSRHFTYAPFKNAYFGVDMSSVSNPEKWEKSNCMQAWWLYPSGETKTECITAIPGLTNGWNNLSIYPLKNGFFTEFFNLTKKGVTSNSGAYLIEGNNYYPLINGVINQSSVSPDGCKVALVQANDFEAMRIGGKGKRALKAINLCEKTEGE